MAQKRKSRFKVGDLAVLTNDWPPFTEGMAVTVEDPHKSGKDNKLKVHDARGISGNVPSKYLK